MTPATRDGRLQLPLPLAWLLWDALDALGDSRPATRHPLRTFWREAGSASATRAVGSGRAFDRPYLRLGVFGGTVSARE